MFSDVNFPQSPTATVVSLLAAALALSEHITVALFATLTAWIASLITVIAFIIDIALFAWTKHQFKKLGVEANTKTGPGKNSNPPTATQSFIPLLPFSPRSFITLFPSSPPFPFALSTP